MKRKQKWYSYIIFTEIRGHKWRIVRSIEIIIVGWLSLRRTAKRIPVRSQWAFHLSFCSLSSQLLFLRLFVVIGTYHNLSPFLAASSLNISLCAWSFHPPICLTAPWASCRVSFQLAPNSAFSHPPFPFMLHCTVSSKWHHTDLPLLERSQHHCYKIQEVSKLTQLPCLSVC